MKAFTLPSFKAFCLTTKSRSHCTIRQR